MSVKTLHFEGTLRMDTNPDLPYVGEHQDIWKNRDVLNELREITGYAAKHECAIQVEVPGSRLAVEGNLDFTEGHTQYGTYTPGSPSKFCVGEEDVLDFLDRYDGKHVVIDIAVPS